MTNLPECFSKKQQTCHGNKSHLLKIFDPTPYLTSTYKKDALILDFLLIVNSQAVVTIAKTFNKFVDWINKFVHHLSSGLFTYWHSYRQYWHNYLRVDIALFDSYCDSSVKPHTLETPGCGHFFLLYEQPMDLQGTFLRHKWNKVANEIRLPHFLQVSCWRMILVLLLYWFLSTVRFQVQFYWC